MGVILPILIIIWAFFKGAYGHWLYAAIGSLVTFFVVAIAIGVIGYVKTRQNQLAATETPSKELDANNPPQTQIKASPASNLICKRIVYTIAHHDSFHGLLEGKQSLSRTYGRSRNYVVAVAEICNEFILSKVDKLHDVTAHIRYRPANGELIEIYRGYWLSGGQRLDIEVNKPYKLVLALTSTEKGEPVCALTGLQNIGYQQNEVILQEIESEACCIEVRIVSEANGLLFGIFNFSLTVDDQSDSPFELIEIKELSIKEIYEQLEAFLRDGNKILKEFPKEKEKTAEDDNLVNSWERKTAAFLNHYPDRFSTALFYDDSSSVKFVGAAHSSNWPTINKLVRRLEKLQVYINETRQEAKQNRQA